MANFIVSLKGEFAFGWEWEVLVAELLSLRADPARGKSKLPAHPLLLPVGLLRLR